MAPKEKAKPETSLGLPTQTALAPKKRFDPSAPSTPEERIVPRVKLIQHSSDEAKNQTAKIGDFVTSTGVNLGQKVTIVPLLRQRQATKFGTDGEGPECRSFDGITGDRYGLCVDCEFNYNKWTIDPISKKNVPPACTAQAAFPSIVIASDADEEATDGLGVVAFQFARTSYPVAKQIITQHDLKGQPYYAFKWEITSKLKPFKKGSAMVCNGRFAGTVEEDMQDTAEEICKAWAGVKIEMADKTEFDDVVVEETTTKPEPKEDLPF